MMRPCWVVLALLATTGAGPPNRLPEPPIPPAHPPTAQSAPIPNPDAQAPLSAEQRGARVSVQDFRVDHFGQSLGYTLGYTPGSQFETSEDKRSIQTPGVAVQLPLH
ncbi:MAG: hypothetical protein WA864_10685 [Acetobacteraceae bacterium]|jgi:hypothetical protein